MKRRGLIALLFGGAAAAGQTFDLTCNGSPCPSVAVNVPDLRRKPKNGECPVCGDMAEPITEKVTGITCELQASSPSGCKQGPVPAPPQVVRCAHCNNAFWQDAEK